MAIPKIHVPGISQAGAFQPISPDISICPDCLRELFDPSDRRYRYPFINCAHCGPRFTIIRDIPYDRPLTTMAPFAMCEDCAREYQDPLDRRFHAQPVACPKCGPRVWLEISRQSPISKYQLPGDNLDPIASARQLLAAGSIVAIKGLGGFHLACDATNERAVQTLRARKRRVDKPFALMALDAAAVEAFCFLSAEELALLESRERPIVLLRRRPDSPVAENVAPNNNYLGVMLPYTPLHYLLFSPEGNAIGGRARSPLLVMTGGNLSAEPIAIENRDARERLSTLADYFLLHDRDIETRADDSVVRITPDESAPGVSTVLGASTAPGTSATPRASAAYVIRRSRGYVPYPIRLPFVTAPTLAVGADLRNAFCVTRDRDAFLSQHIGNLENYPTLEWFERQVKHFQHLFRVEPHIIACDLHPDYLSTRYAQEQVPSSRFKVQPAVPGASNLELLSVQHHHAHIAACMAENGLTGYEPVLGIVFDRTGYGSDGKIWGGEFLLARYAGFTRLAHLAYVPLPGGDAGIRRVYRSGLAHLAHAGIEWNDVLPCVAIASDTERQVIRRQLASEFNAPQTSSMGRLFDAVAAITGVREIIDYEAQAAIELEQWVVEDLEAAYDWQWSPGRSAWPLAIDPAPVIRAVVQDWYKQVPPWVIATKFHNAIADLICNAAVLVREREGVQRVALSGGVFQNHSLLTRALAQLRTAGFQVYTHHLVPPNDGGISLGQAVVANAASGG